MKRALLANIVTPSIGGVLLEGEKGTAKSTAVRALTALLPTRTVVAGCACRCNPHDTRALCPQCRKTLEQGETLPHASERMRVVELPLGATEDRVVGTLDVEHALAKGEKRFEGGVLAEANGNILYVDEVNLLDDHIVDTLLDTAAMGVNYVEREGVSYAHPSRFILVGTMNPEEGDLRPQLLDRFGLSVRIQGERNQEARVTVIEQRLAYEDDPALFVARYEEGERALAERIRIAKERVAHVGVAKEYFTLTAEIAIALDVDGHRADITIIKTAKALAALDGRIALTRDDVLAAAELALPHRTRKTAFDERQSEDILAPWRSVRM